MREYSRERFLWKKEKNKKRKKEEQYLRDLQSIARNTLLSVLSLEEKKKKRKKEEKYLRELESLARINPV